jgi:hypothetical protein
VEEPPPLFDRNVSHPLIPDLTDVLDLLVIRAVIYNNGKNGFVLVYLQ